MLLFENSNLKSVYFKKIVLYKGKFDIQWHPRQVFISDE